MTLTLFHNPRCSKSRAAFALLEENNAKFDTVLYLETPPTTDELEKIISLLGLDSARDLMRKGEAEYKELGLAEVDCEQSLIATMCEHPKLIERPLLVSEDKAVIGRPTENLLEII
jgi:arsenate reductase